VTTTKLCGECEIRSSSALGSSVSFCPMTSGTQPSGWLDLRNSKGTKWITENGGKQATTIGIQDLIDLSSALGADFASPPMIPGSHPCHVGEGVECTTRSGNGSSRVATGLCNQCLAFLCDSCAEEGRHGAACDGLKESLGGPREFLSGTRQPECGTGRAEPKCGSVELPVGPREGVGSPKELPARTFLSPVSAGKAWLAAVTRSTCVIHSDEALSLYCVDCRAAVCCLCADVTATRDDVVGTCADVTTSGRHSSHHTKPLGAMSKHHKVGSAFY